MKILFISNFVKTYSLVFQNELETLKLLGHEVEWAANFDSFIDDISSIPFVVHNVPFRSHPIHIDNVSAYKKIVLLLQIGKFDAIVCTTPIGGTIGRLAGENCNIKTIIYSAHGFLFFKGFGLLKNTFYRNIEKYLAKKTNHIITITGEDYENALKFKLKPDGKVFLIHGAGVEIGNKATTSKEEVRSSLGIDRDDYLLISAGALNKNKNNIVVIKALLLINDPKVKYIICGDGELKNSLVRFVQDNKLSERVLFLGYRKDVINIINACDLFVMPSFREGVPRSMLEAMDLGLPCIGSATRGIRELIDEPYGGKLCKAGSPTDFANAILAFQQKRCEISKIKKRNKAETQKYSKENVIEELKTIYKEILG